MTTKPYTLDRMPLLSALGTTVRVALGSDIVREEFYAAWSRCLVHGAEQSSTIEAPPENWPTIELHGPMSAATQAVTRALIERRVGELLMLHAGAVCDPVSGRTIAYVAPGGTGKTTLTHLFGQEYGYITDETVGIEPGLWRIQPYEKPLSFRTPGGASPKIERGPDSLGLLPAHPAPTLSTLMVIRRSSERASPSFTRPGFLDVLPLLVPEVSSLGRLPRPLHLLAEAAQAVDGIWLVEYAEAEQLRHWVRERLG